MPGFLAHVGMGATCQHGGPITVSPVPGVHLVQVAKQAAATVGDQYVIASCAFTVPGPKPQPCVKVQWMVPATRVRVNGQPAILVDSKGFCLSAEQVPQGAPNITVTQIRVRGE